MNLKRFYKQEITAWTLAAGDDGFNKQIVNAPVTFLGRWEDKTQIFETEKGQTVSSVALIYFPDDLRFDIQVQTWLWKGRTNVAVPSSLKDAYQVLHLSKIPDLRNLHSENVALI